MKTKIYIAILMLALIGVAICKAQDPQFSQFYASPTYHNPAFVGSSGGQRALINHRQQWVGLPNAFVTTCLSYDHALQKLNSGVGMVVYHDKAGAGNLRTTSAYGQYAYNLELNKKWSVRFGLEGGFIYRNIDYQNLVFRDQLNEFDIPLTSQALIKSNFEEWGYFDVGAGTLLFSENIFIGASAKHLNRPNQSLLEQKSVVPILGSLTAGYVIPLQNKLVRKKRNYQEIKKELTPVVHYKFQGEFDQLDAGFYFTFAPFFTGLIYRGLPTKNYNPSIYNHDAMIFIAGFAYQGFSFGYSYDFTVSSLELANTAGSHEVSLGYVFANPKQSNYRRKKPKALPCPSHLIVK